MNAIELVSVGIFCVCVLYAFLDGLHPLGLSGRCPSFSRAWLGLLRADKQ